MDALVPRFGVRVTDKEHLTYIPARADITGFWPAMVRLLLDPKRTCRAPIHFIVIGKI
jgi:hypothetical protein